jgi:aspartyl protease family protein
MQDIDLASLLYLVLLGAAILGWFIAENRTNLGQSARMALAWGLIFMGVIAGYGLWNDIRDEVLPSQSVATDGTMIEVPRGPDGHFHLTLELDGTPVQFLVDTGASDIVLTRKDAERVGIDLDALAFLGVARTANGEVRTAYTSVDDISLGPVTFRNVSVAVNAGEMRGSLLGMTYLSRFRRLQIEGDRLTLEP